MDTDMTPAERIIASFGGLTRLAKALGHTNVTTVQGWRARKRIPAAQIPAVIEAGRRLDKPLELSPNDFFDLDASASTPTNHPEGRAA